MLVLVENAKNAVCLCRGVIEEGFSITLERQPCLLQQRLFSFSVETVMQNTGMDTKR